MHAQDLGITIRARRPRAQHCGRDFAFEMAFARMDGKQTSYEPTRLWAYPSNLRWHMVYQREVLQLSFELIGRNLGVDPSTVYRTVTLFVKSGKVDKKKYDGGNLPRKLTDNIFYHTHCAGKAGDNVGRDSR